MTLGRDKQIQRKLSATRACLEVCWNLTEELERDVSLGEREEKGRMGAGCTKKAGTVVDLQEGGQGGRGGTPVKKGPAKIGEGEKLNGGGERGGG